MAWIQKDEIIEDDPIVMYLVVRESLGMGKGKTSAQVGHAVGMLIFEYFDLKEEARKLHKLIIEEDAITPGATPEGKIRYAELSRKLSIMGEWKSQFYRKVTLKADDKEWAKLKIEMPDCALVVDAGLTEIAAGSETVLGLWPMRKSQRPKSVKRLQALE
jgi:peptidyl-tRNA hydrolase